MKNKIETFTAMRGLMALYIVLFHICAFAPFMPENTLFGFSSQTFILSKGYVGVEFFFILSVFVFLLQHKNDNLLNKKNYFNFQIKKLKRLYPLHIFIMLCFIPINLYLQDVAPDTSHIAISTKYLIGHLTLTHAWGWLDQIGFNIIAWYVSAQFFIYLILPLFALLYRKSKSSIVVISLALLAIFGEIAYNNYHPVFGYNNISLINDEAILRALTSVFVGGIVFWAYEVCKQKNIKTNSYFYISLALFSVYLICAKYSPLLIPDVLVNIILGLMILGLAVCKGAIYNLFTLKKLQFLGAVSFGIFMGHGIFVRTLIGFPQYSDLGYFNSLAILAILLLSVYFGYLIQKHIDKPVQLLLSTKQTNYRI